MISGLALATSISAFAGPTPADVEVDEGAVDESVAMDDDESVTTRDDDAEPEPTLVLLVIPAADVRPDNEAYFTRQRRIRAELEAAGFEVLEVALTESIAEHDGPLPSDLARRYGARALVLLHPGLLEAQVWRFEGDKPAERRAVVVGGHVAEERDGVFAVRIAETVQATLISVKAAPRPEPKATAPPPPPPPPPAPVAPRWAARVGAHAAGTTGGLGFMLGPTLGTTIAVGPRRRIGIDVEAFATALAGTTRTEAGEASVGFGLLRGTIGFWPLPAARVSPGVGLGWGMLLAWTRGRGAAPYSGRTDVTVVSTPVAAGDLAISVTRRFRIRLGFRIGVALPAVRVQTSTGTVRTAQPLADGGIAFELVGPGRR